jgi:hypothetical protein
LGDAGGGFGELDAGVGDGCAGGVEYTASEIGCDLGEGCGGKEKDEGGQGTKLHEVAPVVLLG